MKKPVSDNFIYLLAIVLIVSAVFGRVIFFDYIHLDEDVLITGNRFFYKTGSVLTELFRHNAYYPSGASAYYRPLYVLSFVSDTYLGGSPMVFHATNIVLHIMASFLVFVFLKKLQVATKIENGISSGLAIFLSLIFAVHPLVVQAVSWVPARGDILLTIFTLLSVISLSDFLLKQKKKRLAGHLIFFALALFSKETAFVLPVFYIFYIYCFSGKWLFSHTNLGLASGWAVIGVLWFMLRQNALNAVAIGDIPVFRMLEIIFKNFSAFLLYAGKMLLPFNLSVFPVIRDSNLIYGLITVSAIIAYLIWNRSNLTRISFLGLVWLVLFLIPVMLNYDDPNQMAFFEHRAYLPLIGFLILIPDLGPKLNRGYVKIAGVGTIFLLALASYGYSSNFRNGAVFWREAVRVSPSSARAHAELANIYVSEKNFSKAEEEYNRALKLNSEERKVYNNLALLYIKQGLLDVAEQYLKKELEIDPGSVVANFNLGNVYARRNKFKEALFYWQKALETDPNHILTHESLIKYYYLQKDTEKVNYHINEITRRGVPLSQEISQILENIPTNK